MRRPLTVLAFMLFAPSTFAALVLEKVVDGDSVMLNDDGQRFSLRLLDIDAPELAQPGGKQSRRSLMQLCARAEINVTVRGQDRYGRTLGYLYCDGQEASAWQVAQGMAWFNTRYSARIELHALEAEARSQGLGLWQATQPTPPWQWRKQHGHHYRRQE